MKFLTNNIRMKKNIKIAVMQTSISRNAGGLFYSVKSLMKFINKSNKSKIFSIEDEFTVKDIDSWKPLNLSVFKNNLSKYFKYSFKLKNEISAFYPNIIHAHGLWEFPTILSYKLKKKDYIPYIISPRGMLDKWALNNSKFKKMIALFLYEKRNLSNASCIHALCHSEYKSIRAHGLKNPVAIIPNGIDLQDWNILIDKEKNKKRKLLFLGRIHPKKGIPLLIEAVNMLKEDDFSKKWEIIIAGWDQNNHLKELIELTCKYKLDSIIKFIGPIYGVEKHKLLLSVDAFILPSYSEGLPMSILEAFSYGIPVLMTKECNLPDAFNHNAALEIETNKNSVAKKLSKLNTLSNSELVELVENAYNLTKSNYSWESISSQMLELYDWVLGEADVPTFVKLD